MVASFVGGIRTLGVQATQPPDFDGPVVGVSRGQVFPGGLLLADKPRPEALAAIAELRALDLERQVLLTGDRARVARRVGASLGMTDIRAEALPEQKMECAAGSAGRFSSVGRRRRDQRQPGAEGWRRGRRDGCARHRCRACVRRRVGYRRRFRRDPAADAVVLSARGGGSG